jgi:hypothetical protein
MCIYVQGYSLENQGTVFIVFNSKIFVTRAWNNQPYLRRAVKYIGVIFSAPNNKNTNCSH